MSIAIFVALALSSLQYTAEDTPLAIKGVKSVVLALEPKEAKPGQTVTLKLTIELADGYHTYATKQTDKNAVDLVSTIKYPAAGDVVFVGETVDPKDPILKAEPLLGIKELRTYKGLVTFERKCVVNPTVKAGELAVTLPGVVLQICDANNCFPAKSFRITSKLKVLEGPALAIEEAWKDEVEKALKK